jgi:hypothetical protein
VKIAERFGQPPHLVAEWPPDWIAVCETAMAAETLARDEIARREQRAAAAKARANGAGRRRGLR